MTEREWLTSNDPCRLLEHLRRPPADRKLWLYGVACSRAQWHLLTQSASREAVDWVERYADGEAQRDELYGRLEYRSEGVAFRLEGSHQRLQLVDWVGDVDETSPTHDLRGQISHSRLGPEVIAAYFANSLMTLDVQSPYDPTLAEHRELLSEGPLRDIFGNPFRPVFFAPEWRTDTVHTLASQMYASRDFSTMPILADALQDAGCDSSDILNHCRESREHVRGCWVVDLVLGKS